jgi:hypothetical protein
MEHRGRGTFAVESRYQTTASENVIVDGSVCKCVCVCVCVCVSVCNSELQSVVTRCSK